MAEFTESGLNALGVQIVPHGKLYTFIVHNEFATAEIAGHGAHVLAFIPNGKDDLLWVSSQSCFDHDKAIRGGIPVCWPWFGSNGTPAHGIARLSGWELESCRMEPDGSTTLAFLLDASAVCGLSAETIINVGPSLNVQLITRNLSDKDYRLTEALHTYFAVSDAEKISIEGLDCCSFLDSLTQQTKVQRGPLVINKETDLQFVPTRSMIIINDPVWERRIRVERFGSESAVVWNPWVDKAKRMSDFGDEEYHQMVCVEAANINTDVHILPPGGSHVLATRISLC